MDLSRYSIKQLEQLKRDIEKEVARKQHEEKKEALREAKRVAQKYGFALDDLVGGAPKAKKRTGKAPAKFCHPDDPSKTWSGRGRKPQWIKEWEQAGGDLEKLRVV
ncbi:MAG: H-NS histone family protein [Spiribacter salinus]|uniref:H-NS histone family protein n=1 Tax=Spiribacter salinus TaxID=1335746 RepID=A0A540VQT1_9GAMM|nr:MAG: H-NS histone family protein [Spiribacter salinus]